MKVVVIGSAGQLGRDLCPRLAGEVIALTRQDADLTNLEALRSTLSTIRPTIVINCAAYNLVDKAESEPETAFAVNAWGVRNLAMICRELDCVLTHFSTDYVFGLDHLRQTPLTEHDVPGPISAYGISKLTGEAWVRSLCPNSFVIRTCGLYGVWGSGGKGGNFVETMLKVAGQGKPLRVVADQICTPSYTVDIALASIALLETKRYGLYHITNGGACSWFEFAQAIFHLSGTTADLTPIPSKEYPVPARRPVYSVLAKDGLVSAGLPTPRPWPEALAAYLGERKQKQS